MTVHELIEELKKLDKDAKIVMSSDPEWNNIRDIDEVSVEEEECCIRPV